LALHLLGEFRVSVGPRTIAEHEWRLRKAKGLMKVLAVAPHHRLHRAHVIDRLWPDLGPEAGANCVVSSRSSTDNGRTNRRRMGHLQGEAQQPLMHPRYSHRPSLFNIHGFRARPGAAPLPNRPADQAPIALPPRHADTCSVHAHLALTRARIAHQGQGPVLRKELRIGQDAGHMGDRAVKSVWPIQCDHESGRLTAPRRRPADFLCLCGCAR
jgi:hypothetical protein